MTDQGEAGITTFHPKDISRALVSKINKETCMYMPPFPKHYVLSFKNQNKNVHVN